MLLSIIWLGFTAIAFADSDCEFNPVAIPIQDVQLTNGAKIRGYPVAVGNPPQVLSFILDMINNNTYVFDTNGSCTGYPYTTNQCISYRGGLFDESKSGSWTLMQSPTAAGAFPIDTTQLLTTSQWGTDTLTLNSNVSIPNLAIGIEKDDFYNAYHPQHVLGIGPSSTVLSALKSAKVIASNTWSFFWGLNGGLSTAQMNGTIVLGGIDQAKISDMNINVTNPIQYGSYSGCPYGTVVTITQIALNFPNGTVSELLLNPVQACVEPDMQMVMDMSDQAWQLFTQYTGTNTAGRSTDVNFGGVLYDPNSAYQGDMTISLASGSTSSPVDFRISNNQLVPPNLVIDTNGQVLFNTSLSELLINPLLPPIDQDMVKLGRAFFSAAYLLVDYDAMTFTIWKANLTNEVNILPLMDQQTSKSCSVNAINSTSPSSESSPTSSAGKISKSSVGGIVGGLVVGLILLSVLIFAMSWFMKRRKQKETDSAALSLPLPEQVSEKKEEIFVELPARSTSPRVHEASIEAQRSPYELDGTSLGWSAARSIPENNSAIING